LVWLGIGTELVLVFAIIYVPFLQGLFDTAPFPMRYWLFLLAWVPALFLADELRKIAARRWCGNQP
jgi:hypothetical protein